MMRLYTVAVAQNSEVFRNWINLSKKLYPNIATGSILTLQNIGNIDVMLRALESELDGSAHGIDPILTLQSGLSELWVGSAYEVFRIAKNKMPDDHAAKKIHDQLRLLRMPLEKYEVAGTDKLKEPLQMVKSDGTAEEMSPYDNNDSGKEYMMPSRISSNGSIEWNTFCSVENKSLWIERLKLSDEILSYGLSLPALDSR